MLKKLIFTLTTILCIFVISSCGLSKENHAKITQAKSDLTTQKAMAEDIYGKLTTDSFNDRLSELSSKYDEYNSMELDKIKDKEAEEIISGMNELTLSYNSLTDEMNSQLLTEEATAAENAKNLEILCRISNYSGSEISSIILRDNTKVTDTANMLAEGQTLPYGRILEGAVLPIHFDSSSFSLIVTDTLGNENEYPLSIEDAAAAAESGISITLNLPENGAEISNY